MSGRESTTRAGSGFSENPNARVAGVEAAREAMARAGGSACDLAFVFMSGKVDPAAVHDGVRSVLGPDARLAGGYAVGVITNDRLGYEGHQVGVAVLASDRLRVDAFHVEGLGRDEWTAGVALGRQIAAGSYEGDPNLLLLFDLVKSRQATEGMDLNLTTPLLQGISRAIGEPWPRTAGLGMFGDLQANPTWQICDDTVTQDSALALVLHGGIRMDTIIMHGCRPSGGYYAVTRADGKRLEELDGRPAADVVGQLVDPTGDTGWEEMPMFVTFGINKGEKFGEFREDDYTIRLPMAVDRETRALIMAADDLTVGTEVQLMRRAVDFKYVHTRASSLFRKLEEEDRTPVFALYIDCAARAGAYCGSPREEAEAVQEIVNEAGVPMLGMYAGIEIAKVGTEVHQNNMTGVLCLLSEDA